MYLSIDSKAAFLGAVVPHEPLSQEHVYGVKSFVDC
jgi:hypothetical protein